MTQHKQTSIPPTDEKSTARKKSYLSYLERYHLYATLLVLEEYEKTELYEECAIIRDALTDYKNKYESHFPKELDFPMHASEFRSKKCQEMMKKLNLTIEEKIAKEKATLIKLNLPLTDEYR